MVVGDNNNVIITRPEAIIENSMELVSNSETIILPPLKQEKIKQTKKVVKAKGKKRRK
jgi:hypothetical protein